MNDHPAVDDARVEALTDPTLAPMFWRPSRLGVGSSWYGHVPFAHWLVAAHRPACIVELGAHNGVSYAAFCEAVLREQLDTRCMAIDTWQGDKHAGFYGSDVLEDLRRFHQARYAGFSTLLQSTFDDALAKVPDASIDLLHIDGRHTYADASHDFTSWQAKLSPRAVVLFHDTNERGHDFGVWQLWAELREQYPSFEFLHAHGLGVLAWGAEAGGAVAALCTLRHGRDVNAVRERFALLGDRWIAAGIADDMKITRQWAEAAQAEVNKISPLYGELLQTSQQARAALAVARHDLAARERDNAALPELRAANVRLSDDAAALRARLAAVEQHAHALEASARSQIEALYAERAVMLGSTSWRATAPLRGILGLLRRRRNAPEAPGDGYYLPALDEPALPPLPGAAAAPPDAAAAAETPAPSSILFVSGEDHTPGTIYRCERYAAAARALGLRAHCLPAVAVGPDDLQGQSVVVLWRVPFGEHVQGIFDFCRDRGILVTYDVDDLMFRPELAVIDVIDGIRSQRFSEIHTQAFFSMIGRALKESDVVTCPTEELAHEARRLGRPAWVMPNGFDDTTHATARRARAEWSLLGDDLLRIGYAGGSRTHQRDFAVAVPAIARILRELPQARLVLFKNTDLGGPLILLHEFTELADLEDRIEWREVVPVLELPNEIARFTVNIAPLEPNNPFCEAKSELKYFEAGLANVPTVASPSGPFRRAIVQGVTGCLAGTQDEWYDCLKQLLTDSALRARLGRNAYHDALAKYGPDAQRQALALMLGQLQGGAIGAATFERARYRAGLPAISPPLVPDCDVIWRSDNGGAAAVSVIVPVYNYADFAGEALASVAAQTLPSIDLVVIDDASPDDSSDMVQIWLRANAGRFNRATLLRHRENSGLGFARNSGFAAAETPFVLPLDADNRLRPQACAALLAALADSHAAFAYPAIQQFGTKSEVFGKQRYSVLALQQGNYIDAMALVRKAAWAAAGGYDNVKYGWEDYDFWCRLAERGHFGISVPEILADYRVHAKSMLHTTTEVADHKGDLIDDLTRRHPWLDLPR